MDLEYYYYYLYSTTNTVVLIGVYHTVSVSRGNGSALITFTEDHSRTAKLRTTNPRLRVLHG